MVFSRYYAVALLAALMVSSQPVFAADAPAGVAAVGSGTLSGAIVDASTGLPLSGVRVQLVGAKNDTLSSDGRGRFTFASIPPGIYHVSAQYGGYAPADTESIAVLAGQNASITVSLQRQQSGGQGLRVIGATTTRASQSLQKSSIVYKSASADTIEREGYYRVGDYLRTLPQVNTSAATGGSDTPSPGDDLYLDIRGIGGLETVALLDGHPIGFGINRGKNLGYNFEVSPTFALRNVQVNYGSGAEGLTPYSAVGGTIDMQTLEPTPKFVANLSQGYGTFNKAQTSLNATGPITSRLGFAVAAGVQSIDGPYKNLNLYQPGAAYDPSAPVGSSVYNLGIYKDDSAVVNRGDFLKLRYAFGHPDKLAHLTLSALSAYYWDDKTGNGDQDFEPYNTALAIGNSSLGAYSPGTFDPTMPASPSNVAPCPTGQFTPLNAGGVPWGFSPSGTADGGTSCVTPQQYAKLASGFQGAGTTFQTFTIDDYHLKYEQPYGVTDLVVDGFTNRFFQLYDRTFQLPFNSVPGDNASTISPSVSTTGGSITDTLPGRNNDIGVGYSVANYAYKFITNGNLQPSPIVHDYAEFLQDVYHPQNGHFIAYLNAAEKTSTITHTTVFDPRLALVYNVTPNDVIRLAAGSTTVQPYATYIDLPYSPISLGALNGNLNCTGLTTIGQVANPNLDPERANDKEISIGHRFEGDSQIQATVYSENVNNKIYSSVIPVAGLPAGIIDPTLLGKFQTRINASCGTTGLSGVGVNSQANVGRLLAQGLDINGRARATRKLFFDYDYSIESTALESAPVTLLQNNLTLIQGAQLPGVPLHKAQIAADGTFGRNIDVRYTQYFVSSNNSKNMGAFNYGDFQLNVPTPHGAFNVVISNLFNQFVQYNGLIGNGYPLPLNQYATAANYAPYIGSQATELYGLPYRQIFLNYSISTR